MFDLFKRNKESPDDAKTIRDALLRFIKESLQQLEGGEGGQLRNIQLYMAPEPAMLAVWEAAVYLDRPGFFQQSEVQRIADDYALDLPLDWRLELIFTESLPEAGRTSDALPAALILQSGRKAPLTGQPAADAFIKVLHGSAEQQVYQISPASGRVNIGRGRHVQTAGGFFRENQIAFPEDRDDAHNRYISRQHAHIEYDAASGSYILFADEGGVPPRNKLKVRSMQSATPLKLSATQIGHRLQPGDQIMLGESALLEFHLTDPQSHG